METATIVMFAAAALLVRVGMAWYAAGLSRSKNAAGAVLRQVYDLCTATLAFILIGAAIMQANGRFPLGLSPGLVLDLGGYANHLTLVNLALVLIACGIVPAVMGERSKFWPRGFTSVLLAGLVVPLAGQWAWNGWLRAQGFIDIAGASVVHMTAGLCAAAGAVLVGPRGGKYNRDGSSNFIPGHSVPLASVGVVMMLIGWIAYVCAAAAVHRVSAGGGMLDPMVQQLTVARAALNVLAAAAAGGLTALVCTQLRYGKPDIFLVYSGIMGALVAICASASIASMLFALCLGVFAGIAIPWVVVRLDLNWKIDDPSGGIAIHGVGGALGALAAAIPATASNGSMFRQLSVHALAVAAIGILALGLCAVALWLLKATVGLRSSEADEFDGLDLAEHDINAYPDFQQTMIKSYHLREA
jgi:Amt family ammonium transporter